MSDEVDEAVQAIGKAMDVPEELLESDTLEAAIKSMNDLHVELARKAATLAMNLLESIDLKDIPVPSAVALLKFGVDLERKALLGSEDDQDTSDPFASLAAAMNPSTNEKGK